MDLNDWDNLFIKTYKELPQYLAQSGRSNFIEKMGDIMHVRIKMLSVSSAVLLGWTGDPIREACCRNICFPPLG